jgi:hypothetical protein
MLKNFACGAQGRTGPAGRTDPYQYVARTADLSIPEEFALPVLNLTSCRRMEQQQLWRKAKR